MSVINVGVVGAGGRMGATVCQAVAADAALALVAAVDPHAAGQSESGVTIAASLDALADAGLDPRIALSPVGEQLRQAIGVLLTRAQRAGAVRDDIGITELIALVVGASRAAEHAGWDRDVQARTLAVIFNGLRPPAAS